MTNPRLPAPRETVAALLRQIAGWPDQDRTPTELVTVARLVETSMPGITDTLSCLLCEQAGPCLPGCALERDRDRTPPDRMPPYSAMTKQELITHILEGEAFRRDQIGRITTVEWKITGIAAGHIPYSHVTTDEKFAHKAFGTLLVGTTWQQGPWLLHRTVTTDGHWTAEPCCDSHNQHCEPPSELCCHRCAETQHPRHPADIRCVLETP